MTTKRIAIGAVLVATLAVTGPGEATEPPTGEREDRVAALETALEVLAEEVAFLRGERSAPAGPSGSGAAPEAPPTAPGADHVPATGARKAYTAPRGVSLGGYGEFLFGAPIDGGSEIRTADYHRFITYVGTRFSDRIVMNTELEFEHGTSAANPSGKTGSISVEFSYLDFLLRPDLHVRAGNLLIPMGFVNRIHEPPFRRGNDRPTIEKQIIPTTWRELGAGVHGSPGPVRYEVYVVNGVDAAGFGANGIRGGRQKGNRARWEDLAVTASLQVEPSTGWNVGGSVFTGQADQGREFDGRTVDARVTVAEAHGEVRWGPFQGRTLVAGSSLTGTGPLSAELEETIPSRQRGAYLELSVDVASHVGLPPGQSLLVWARGEDWDLHREVAGGLARDPARDGRSLVAGLEYFPHPEVVIKADVTAQDDEAGGDSQIARVGTGFVF